METFYLTPLFVKGGIRGIGRNRKDKGYRGWQ